MQTATDERKIEEYEINPYTVMIKPIEVDGNIYSEIYELEDRFWSPEKPIDIVKRSCKYFGSSFEGRRDGTIQLINVTHKAPIIVDHHTSIYLFPTTSPLKPQCIWISHEHVKSHQKNDRTTSLVLFQNNEIHEIPISYTSFGNQLTRTASLRISFKQNIKRMERYGERFLDAMQFRASERKKPYRTNDD